MDQTLIAERQQTISLGDRLDKLAGTGPGFDWVRTGLALTILFWHSFVLAYGTVLQEPVMMARLAYVRPFISCLLPMFFALSGFLVMGSAQRVDDLRTFLTFRILRIVPALAVEITLSAIVLGGLMTTLPLRSYFSNTQFIEYFGSIIGRIKYSLPGVFLDNPVPGTVNSALWTVGPEILCYVMMAIIILTTLHHRPRRLLEFVIFYLVVCFISDFLAPPWILDILPTKILVLSFLAGNLLYSCRYNVPFSGMAASCFGIISIILIALTLKNNDLLFLCYASAMFLAYLTVYIGLLALPKMPFFSTGDYTYGIYIFGFPVQQTIVHLLTYRTWWNVFAISLPVTIVIAAASWNFVEKPALGLRKYIVNFERVTPAPPISWPARRWLLAVAICAYGLFVMDQAEVFPYRMIGHNILHKHSPFVPQPHRLDRKIGPV